jgi:uncharacterized repeat protein (TIGR03803 family)
MQKIGLAKMSGMMLVLCAAAAITSAQTYDSLVSFNGTNGAVPYYGSLVQGTDGNLYGTTFNGGANNDGTVFKMTPLGTLTTIYSFCPLSGCADGAHPSAGLVLGPNGHFYGTTQLGGTDSSGTVFEITTAGALTTLYRFCSLPGCADGSMPTGGLVQAVNGSFYGTTIAAGGNDDGGTIYKINPTGVLTTLHNFCSLPGCTDGGASQADLIQGTDGNFYGTAAGGLGSGVVFKVTPSGDYTTLHRFCSVPNCADGGVPTGALVQASNGNFYGTTSEHGLSVTGEGYGTVFEMTPTGRLITLHDFDYTDGCCSVAGLLQATDGNLYGVTSSGYGTGNQYGGTVFKMTLTGDLTTLYAFCVCDNDGFTPIAGLLQATNGTFYGTTWQGGTNDEGTVFSLSVGLGSFVTTRPSSARVGATIIILGSSLSGATSVTFTGTAAAFTVVSDTEITATVPIGATSGTVKVIRPGIALSSNIPFRVVP